jgi:hypothetical protein
MLGRKLFPWEAEAAPGPTAMDRIRAWIERQGLEPAPAKRAAATVAEIPARAAERNDAHAA